MPEYSLGEQRILVVGHKNPDTDSICSAISYAYLKNMTDDKVYEPIRAGNVSSETRFVLNYFGVEEPTLCTDVSIQLKDIELRKMSGVNENLSLKNAWSLMRDSQIDTLPVVDDQNNLIGLITVKVIATSNMDIYDSNILSTSNTLYKNILETIDGDMIVGSDEGFIENGKIVIATADPGVLENVVESGDIVVMGNRYESQLCAIEKQAGVLILCLDAPVASTIQAMAKHRNCRIIVTPHDTYKVSRLISQSAPIGFFMKKSDLITFNLESTLDDATTTMVKERHKYFPVLDNKGDYLAMISRRNLLNKKAKQIILVDHNEKTQAIDGISEAEILEIIDHHRIGNLETMSPVFFRNYPLGATATIIAGLFKERCIEIPKHIAGLLCSAIISDTLIFRSPTCTQIDINTAQELSKIADINIDEYAEKLFYAGSDIKDKSPKEVFYSDFKIFTHGEIKFGVGQCSFMNQAAVDIAKDYLNPFLHTAFTDENVDMLFYMFTNIISETTELMYYGEKTINLMKKFPRGSQDNTVILKDVVSRKKQFIPLIMNDITSM